MARKPASDHPPLPTADYEFPAIPRGMADRAGGDEFHQWLDDFAGKTAARQRPRVHRPHRLNRSGRRDPLRWSACSNASPTSRPSWRSWNRSSPSSTRPATSRPRAAAGRRLPELKPVVEAYRAYRATDGRARRGARDARRRIRCRDARVPRERDRRRSSAASPSSTPSCASCSCPRDPDDGKNVIVEIRGGEGGEEANLWAADLFHMYERYADLHKWKIEVLTRQASDMGGSARSRSW